MEGCVCRVPTLNGQKEIRISPGTQSQSVIKLKGEGISRTDMGHRRGDLHVHVIVEMPKNLTSRQRQLLQDFHEHPDEPDEPQAQPASRFGLW